MDGTYDTDLTGRGHLGGEHKVMIAGFDGVQGDIMDPDAMAIPMFDVITFTEDLPIESTTVDFALPLDLVDAAP